MKTSNGVRSISTVVVCAAALTLTACGEKGAYVPPGSQTSSAAAQTSTGSAATEASSNGSSAAPSSPTTASQSTPATPASPSKPAASTPTQAKPAATIKASVSASSDRTSIMALQYLLNDNGASLPAIGSYGSRTSAAVKRFQLTHHLGESGQADGRTLAALVKPLSAGVGVSNTVKALQTLLNKAGASLPVTGVFGSQTQTALATVKKKAKLSATATADPATWAYLFSIKPATPKGGNWQACTKAINAGLPIQKTAVAKNGARVAACLVANMNLMIDAAARSGITLKTNSAWRSRADQVALRKQNCGTTQYSIYKMPQARCKPPTAIPGTSIHELGLAIDLKNSQVGTPTYTWMKQYGKYFGFRHTVATEPWHWDTKQREVKG